MNKNKFIVFIATGFEFTSLILVAIWLGDFLVEKGYSKNTPAFCILGAFLIWFTSLIVKLKKLKND